MTQANRVMLPDRKKKAGCFRRNWQMYAMLLPILIIYIVFRYVPMGALVIAFQDYNIFKGIAGSEWVGLAHFRKLFGAKDFYNVFRNTLEISLLKVAFGFPAPILLAILLNEMKSVGFRRVCQNIYYLPHFVSWVIISGLCTDIFAKNGVINRIVMMFGAEPIFFLGENGWFRFVLIVSDVWKGVGWGSIIYLAALTGIDPGLYEAAEIDGASRLRKIISITLPAILPTIAIMLVLRMASIMDAGQDQILLMQNPMVRANSEIIDTFVYKQALEKGKYSYSTAVGLFKSVVSLILVVASEAVRKRAEEV